MDFDIVTVNYAVTLIWKKMTVIQRTCNSVKVGHNP